ncbi:hypothetical protein [Tropicimonas sp. IMCC6043]|uniref:hypothetical protein n=1 Tax=Tropicimonas sp. IMCC6043 TaxID=2510645 RepID=UPI00101D73E7|nr:hypothetical protein [Tropicimonas sp. IMCC6043]RYH08104.1 hypothetical protein EU800_17575 [Tropicimonas sp. IMCC6043]
MTHPTFLETQIASTRFPERDSLRFVDLPDIPAVRAEVEALLETDAPPQPRPRPLRRLWDWAPRWVLWLRAMPLP